MKYLTKPTARLPNGRLIIDDQFAQDLVDAVNQLNDCVKAIEVRLEASESNAEALGEELGKTKNAVGKVAEAVNVLIGD